MSKRGPETPLLFAGVRERIGEKAQLSRRDFDVEPVLQGLMEAKLGHCVRGDLNLEADQAFRNQVFEVVGAGAGAERVLDGGGDTLDNLQQERSGPHRRVNDNYVVR